MPEDIIKGKIIFEGGGGLGGVAGAIPSSGGGGAQGEVAGGLVGSAAGVMGMQKAGLKKIGMIGAAVMGIWQTLKQMKEASPKLQATLKIFHKALMLTLRPIGDVISMILRPFALWWLRIAVKFYKWLQGVEVAPTITEAMAEAKANPKTITDPMGVKEDYEIYGPTGTQPSDNWVPAPKIDWSKVFLPEFIENFNQGAMNIAIAWDEMKTLAIEKLDVMKTKLQETILNTDWWGEKWDNIKTKATETILSGDWWGEKWDDIKGSAVGKFLKLDWWDEKFKSIKTKAKETIFSGEWWKANFEKWKTWATETIFSGEWWKDKWDLIKTWASDTLFSKSWWDDKFSTLRGWWGDFINWLSKKTGIGYQTGGYISETGMYQLHQGETVIPAHMQGMTNNFTPNITINANIASGMDLQALADQLSGIMMDNLSRRNSYTFT